jgi:hypothetical protein
MAGYSTGKKERTDEEGHGNRRTRSDPAGLRRDRRPAGQGDEPLPHLPEGFPILSGNGAGNG